MSDELYPGKVVREGAERECCGESAVVLRCIWCCRDTKTNPCEHCGSGQVCDRTKPHSPHWSRKTIRTVECKICDREIPYEQHGLAGDICTPNAAISDSAAMCQSCNKNQATPDHTCPYAEDINNDSETMCNCCDACQNQCCMDI